MSYASCSYQCGFIEEDATFTVSLLGVTGDVEQRYTGTPQSPGVITPNLDGTAVGAGPVIRVVLMESDANITQADLAQYVVDSETSYYIDGLKLEFGNDGVSVDSTSGGATGYVGCFRKLLADKNGNGTCIPTLASAPFGGLEIRKNLVTPTGGKSVNVGVSLGISHNGKAIRRQGTTRIKIIKVTGATNFATIYCDAGDSFVIDEDDPTVTCKVRCWQGEAEVTTFYRKWYIMSGGQWVQKSTADEFTVGRDDVATFADIRVECYSDSARTKLIAADVQTVSDASDGYILSPCPNPPDGTFSQNGTTDITFSPVLQNADGTPVTENYKLTYAVMDSTGNVVQSVTATNALPKGSSFTVSHEVANGMGEGPIVSIEAISA